MRNIYFTIDKVLLVMTIGFMLFHVAVLYWKFTGNYPAWTCFADIPFPAGVTPPADEIDESST